MSRAVLLPSPGDPFLLDTWRRHYLRWAEHVDQLYVGISWAKHHAFELGPETDEVRTRIREDFEGVGAKVIEVFWHEGETVDHGSNLERLLGKVTEDHILLTEDDFFWRNPGAVRVAFEEVENGDHDICSITRGACATEVVNAYGAPHPALSPCFTLARTNDLRHIESRWTSREWRIGDEIMGLKGYRAQEDNCCADTFVAASIELREGRTVQDYPEITAEHPSDDPPYFHIGSLSVGPGETLLSATESGTYGRRIAWWDRCAKHWPGGLEAQHRKYTALVDALRANFAGETGWYDEVYSRLVNWED